MRPSRYDDPYRPGAKPVYRSSLRAYAMLALFWIALAALGGLFMFAVGWAGTWGTP